MRCELLGIQVWEKKRHLQGRVSSNQSHGAGPSRLLRPHSHHGCRHNRARSVGKEEDNHTNTIHEENRVGFARSASTVGECSTVEMLPVPSHIQLARDSCLSIPKHPPKFCVAIHRGCRLFGQHALLPLQSQVRIAFLVQTQPRALLAPSRPFETRNTGTRKATQSLGASKNSKIRATISCRERNNFG